MIKPTHFYAFRTYSGCLEGLPPNEQVVASIKDTLVRMWGPRPTYLEQPEGDGRLPNWVYCIWLDGPALAGGDGAELVWIYFTERPPIRSMDVDEVLGEDKWREHAKDYEV